MKGLDRSLSRGNPLKSNIIKDSIAFDLTVSVTDGAPGFGTAVIQGLPEGNLLYFGAVISLDLFTADGDVIATFSGDFSVGTAPTADGTLSGAEVDLIASTAIGPATAGVTPVTRGASTDSLQGGVFDNTAGTLELNLNVIIDDASISGDADFTATGVLHIAYTMLGDD